MWFFLQFKDFQTIIIIRLHNPQTAWDPRLWDEATNCELRCACECVYRDRMFHYNLIVKAVRRFVEFNALKWCFLYVWSATGQCVTSNISFKSVGPTYSNYPTKSQSDPGLQYTRDWTTVTLTCDQITLSYLQILHPDLGVILGLMLTIGDISTRPDWSWGNHQVPNISCSLKVNY